MFFNCHDVELSQDQLDMQLALQVLNVTEFRLFELAYNAWFGDVATENELEHSYTPYLFTGILPCWVRQYIRNIRELSKEAGVVRTARLQEHRGEQRILSGMVTNSTLLLVLLFSMLLVLLK